MDYYNISLHVVFFFCLCGAYDGIGKHREQDWLGEKSKNLLALPSVSEDRKGE